MAATKERAGTGRDKRLQVVIRDGQADTEDGQADRIVTLAAERHWMVCTGGVRFGRVEMCSRSRPAT